MTGLTEEPTARAHTLPELMSLAAAMESEAVARYGQLAAEMTARSDHGLAATFHAMIEEERDHLSAIERWSRALTGKPPQAAAQPWHLPPEIARSWEELAAGAGMTPYRALSIAVLNEERGFAFYSYVAAHATDPNVQAAAERLAAEELTHAALLRRERRRAFRRERRAIGEARNPRPTTSQEFAQLSSQRESQAAVAHALIAERLAALGNEADAAALKRIAEEERGIAAAVAGTAAAASPPAAVIEPLPQQSRIELLRAGLAEVERLYEVYVDVADHAGAESVIRAAQDGAERAIRHLGAVATRLHLPAKGV